MDIDRLIADCLAGDKRATSRLISLVERDADQVEEILARTYPHADEAFYIGITGPPGSGKSTLVDRLTRCFCANGHSVGVIAVDPCSPFSGGALLGDRIRMSASADRPDVFFRSMSAGRVMGGLSRAARDASRILAASGRKVIMIETVGVGQSELDIAQATDSVVVVLMPGAGDGIQLMKAGLMEIADIFVVNKADRPESDHLQDAVVQMLAHRRPPPAWAPPVLLTAASLDRGIETVYDRLWDHRRHLARGHRLAARRQAQLRTELRRRVEDELLRHLWRDTAAEKTLDLLVEETEKHRIHPQKQARRMAARYLAGGKK